MSEARPFSDLLPPESAYWARLTLRDRASLAGVGAAIAVGVVADQGLRTGSVGLGFSLAIGLGGLALVWIGVQRLEPQLYATFAVVFGAWLTVRASPWLLWPDLIALLLLLGMAASLSVRGTMLDLGLAEAVARAHGLLHLSAGADFILRPIVQSRPRVGRILPIVRGLLIAVPLAVLVAALLASADPIFASFVRFNLDFGQLALDILYVLLAALAMAGLLRIAAAEPLLQVDGPVWRLGAVEGLVVLAVLDAVFAGFAVAQAIGASGAGGETLRAAGVSYADYARSGFFQLLWVAGITLVALLVFSRLTGFTGSKARPAFVLLGELAVALTLLIVFVAFARLRLYEDAYGFSMLRLYSHIFAGWIALVFLLFAGELAGLWSRRRWFLGSVLVTTLVALLALNLANPEAIVVQLNTDHAKTTHKLDTQYLGELSTDAVPALLATRTEVDPNAQSAITSTACGGQRSYSPNWAAFNWSSAAAAAARRLNC